jgi:hypothetical protein
MRSTGFFFIMAIAMGSMPVDSAAQLQLYTRVEPFDGVRLGMSYDMAAQRPALAGRPCIDFDAQKFHLQPANPPVDSSSERITRKYDLVKKMELTADAQLKAITGSYAIGSRLDLADTTEAHQYSETTMLWSYRMQDTPILLSEYITLKPEYIELLKKGPQGRDEFRARCGTGFVIGMQTGEYYYGTLFTQTAIEQAVRTVKLNVTYSIKSSINSGGYLDYKRSVDEKKEKAVKSAKASHTDNQLPNSEDPETIKQQWTNFKATGRGAQVVRVLIAPYSAASNVPVGGVLSEDRDQTRLDKLLESLWDLKTLMEAGSLVLREPNAFAMGVPGLPGGKRSARLAYIRSAVQGWNKEYDQLLDLTKRCVKDFKPECKVAADKYGANPTIAQRDVVLPRRYGSQCYGEVEVRLIPEPVPEKSDRSATKDYVRRSGDDEMGGGPVKVKAKVLLRPDGRRLIRGTLNIHLEEDKKDHSTFEYSKEFDVFDLVSGFDGKPNPLEECRVPTARFTRLEPVIKGSNIHGLLTHRTEKNERWVTMRADNNGILPSLTCMVDGVGRDDWVRCEPPRLNSIPISLVNALDEEADQWSRDSERGMGHRDTWSSTGSMATGTPSADVIDHRSINVYDYQVPRDAVSR